MAASANTWRLLPSATALVAMLAATPLLRFYADNVHEGLDPFELAAYASGWIALAVGLYALLHALLRPTTPRLAALFAVLLLAGTSYYDVAFTMQERGAGYLLQNSAWLGFTAALLALAALLGARRSFHHFLLLFATVSLLIPCYTIATYELPQGPRLPAADAYPLADDEFWSGQAVRKPNVYWLVADSYPNAVELALHYRFDNSKFLEALEARGFYVANQSYANFSTTRLSIPSTLNMQYVLEDGEKYSESRGSVHVRLPGNTNSGMIAAVAGDNRTVAFLRQLGYRYVHFEGNSFHLTRCRGREDVCIRGGGLSELQLSLLSLLPIRIFVGWGANPRPPLMLRRSPSESGTGIPELGAALAELSLEPPFFLYAHFASPHAPFYNDAQCRRSPHNYPINPHQFSEQLQCVNRHLEALLDQIIADDPEAIILLSSDHGPRMSVRSDLPTHALSEAQVRESLGILNAFRLPESCRGGLHPRLSPVNSMRIVFGCIGGHAPRLIEEKFFIARPSADRGNVRRVDIH